MVFFVRIYQNNGMINFTERGKMKGHGSEDVLEYLRPFTLESFSFFFGEDKGMIPRNDGRRLPFGVRQSGGGRHATYGAYMTVRGAR